MTRRTFVKGRSIFNGKERYKACSSKHVLLTAGVILTLASSVLLSCQRYDQFQSPIDHNLNVRQVIVTPTATPTPTPIPPTPTPTPIPPTPTPTPTPFVPQPGPDPINPLPIYVSQQIAVLQANDRFFYNGNLRLPEVALTFDDGPNPPYTGQILDILKQYHVKATFFDMGSHVASFPDLAQREDAEGHLVGNHTWAHPNMPTLSTDDMLYQLNLTGDTLQRTLGKRPTFFRPPYGAFDARVLKIANQLGLTTVQWNVDARDWELPSPATITYRIVSATHNGSIILLHDGGGDRSRTVAALPAIIEQLQARGFQFVTLQQMVNDNHK
ncbi:polysaccharide deacetylase family protein [Tengunoibacter tsumagoiensis]|uniref:NodB homology domain-containing protein n=1 Tax=Tengunoibacter tsumagoiensis TaxID=2014871 RepID=A0A401ZVC3_9CHLR|nr:polysaccharide deacetylase family protein [Tengunoibacter tsumagoiensis]GCE10690.1 hypothetical protein KTT_05490 [Tengunoibacter tsumagoiensis]